MPVRHVERSTGRLRREGVTGNKKLAIVAVHGTLDGVLYFGVNGGANMFFVDESDI